MRTKAHQHFKVKLEKLMDEFAGGNQTKFAEYCGINPSDISRWIQDKSSPGLESLESISTATGVPIGLLVSDGALPIIVKVPVTDDQIVGLVAKGLKTLHDKLPDYDIEICELLSSMSDQEKKAYITGMKMKMHSKKKTKP